MATKNNLDEGGEAPVHKELAARYSIEGNVYDLGQIVAAVKGEQSNDEWNGRTLTDRLGVVKAYIADMKAEKVDDTANTSGDGAVKDGLGNVLVTEGQAAGSSGGVVPADKPTTQEADQNAENVDTIHDLRDSNMRMADVLETARIELGLAETDDDEMPSITEGIQALKQRMDDVRGALGIRAEDDVIEAIKDQALALSEAERRATEAEQHVSSLTAENNRLKNASTRDKPLHGFVDDLKAPY